MMVDSFLRVLICMIMAVFAGKIFIPILHKLKFGQMVREEGPKSHVKKNGTPTMGGIIFILPIVIGSLLFLDLDVKSQYPMIALVLFAFVGFTDDLLKIKRGKNLGLTAKQKMMLLFIISLFLSFVSKRLFGTEIVVPFMSTSIDIGYLYIPVMMFIYIGASNAVNLTDGLDGLASSVTIVVLSILAYIAYKLGFGDTMISCIIAAGSLIGFLFFNINPAKVFMGDTGSLSLGGFLVAITSQMNLPLILVLVGVMYIVETLSVIIQVASFKITGKRVFKMSPIHHHYEMCGFSENKIVAIFSIVTILFGILSIISV